MNFKGEMYVIWEIHVKVWLIILIIPDPFWRCSVLIWSQSHWRRLIKLCIKASHTQLQRGISKFDSGTNIIQLDKLYASWAHEVYVKNWISHCAKRNEIHGSGKLGFILH